MVKKLRVHPHGKSFYPSGLSILYKANGISVALQIIHWISNRSQRGNSYENHIPWCSIRTGRFLIIIQIALWTTQLVQYVDSQSVAQQINSVGFIWYKTSWQKVCQLSLSMWIHSWGTWVFPQITSLHLNPRLNHVILSFYKIQYRAKAVSRQVLQKLLFGLIVINWKIHSGKLVCDFLYQSIQCSK